MALVLPAFSIHRRHVAVQSLRHSPFAPAQATNLAVSWSRSTPGVCSAAQVRIAGVTTMFGQWVFRRGLATGFLAGRPGVLEMSGDIFSLFSCVFSSLIFYMLRTMARRLSLTISGILLRTMLWGLVPGPWSVS